MRLAILGAGITGMSISVLAKCLGWEVDIYSEQYSSDVNKAVNPKFATPYAAASVIPYGIAGNEIGSLFSVSNSFFTELAQNRISGVRRQKHMKLWTGHEPTITNLELFKDVEEVSSETHSFVPTYKHQTLKGLAFDINFVDMPIYLKWLNALALEMGVKTHRVKFSDAASLELVKADVVVNALGSGSERVFGHLGEYHYLKGIILRFPCAHLWTEKSTRRPMSYNFYLEDSELSHVSAYPRHDSISFAGLCEVGLPTEGGQIEWEGKGEIDCVQLQGSDERVPRALLETNRELVKELTGRAVQSNPEVLVGYRHLCGSPGNPTYRLEKDILDNSWDWDLYNCYGFGGAGVTLSWGAAAKIISLIKDCELGTIELRKIFSLTQRAHMMHG